MDFTAEQTPPVWRLDAPLEAIQACLGTGYVCFEDNHWSVVRGTAGRPAPKPDEPELIPAG